MPPRLGDQALVAGALPLGVARIAGEKVDVIRRGR